MWVNWLFAGLKTHPIKPAKSRHGDVRSHVRRKTLLGEMIQSSRRGNTPLKCICVIYIYINMHRLIVELRTPAMP